MTDLLITLPNIYRNKHYVISLIEKITVEKENYRIGLRYIPDKLLLDHNSLKHYLIQILEQNSRAPETLAHDILEAMSNRIIPRWIEINLLHKQKKSGQKILVTMEDRQPGFEDDAILGRLPDMIML